MEDRDANPEQATKIKLMRVLQELKDEQLQLLKKNKEHQRRLAEYFRMQNVNFQIFFL